MKTPLCALMLLFACTGAAETLWPGDGTVGLVAGNCATVETRGGLALVHVGACKATLWPGAYFAFPAPRGLVSTTDVPYTELVGAIRDVSASMYPRRAAAAVR